jgi:hypothetical protein
MSVRSQSESQHAQIHRDKIDTANLAIKDYLLRNTHIRSLAACSACMCQLWTRPWQNHVLPQMETPIIPQYLSAYTRHVAKTAAALSTNPATNRPIFQYHMIELVIQARQVRRPAI